MTEVFHREGRKVTSEQIHEIMEQADPEHKGKISFEDFTRIMKTTIISTDWLFVKCYLSDIYYVSQTLTN